MERQLKISKSKSASFSAQSSPLQSPAAAPSSPTGVQGGPPASPRSPGCPKHAAKASLAEKGKALLLRLPSLSRSRSRSRNSSPITSPVPWDSFPKAVPSPLGLASTCDIASSSNSAMQTQQESGKNAPFARGSHIEEMKRVFEEFDTNNDGKISAEELQHVLTALGDKITRNEAELIIADADTDKDGFINMQEFLNLNMRGSSSSSSGKAPLEGDVAADELAAAFEIFDLDKKGCITPKNLHRVLSNLGNHDSTLEDCKRMIGNIDQKGCGVVDFDDFKEMMTTSNTRIMA